MAHEVGRFLKIIAAKHANAVPVPAVATETIPTVAITPTPIATFCQFSKFPPLSILFTGLLLQYANKLYWLKFTQLFASNASNALSAFINLLSSGS